MKCNICGKESNELNEVYLPIVCERVYNTANYKGTKLYIEQDRYNICMNCTKQISDFIEGISE
jgi:hypothetical protein